MNFYLIAIKIFVLIEIFKDAPFNDGCSFVVCQVPSNKELDKLCYSGNHESISKQKQLRAQFPNLQLPDIGVIKAPIACLYSLVNEVFDANPFGIFGQIANQIETINKWIDTTVRKTKPSGYINWLVNFTENGIPSKENLTTDQLEQLLKTVLYNFTKYENLINNVTINATAVSDQIKLLHDAEDMLLNSGQFETIINDNRAELAKYLSPVILIPGLAGSRLDAEIDRNYSSGFLCPEKESWVDVWISILDFIPFEIDCWVNIMEMKTNLLTGQVSDSPGVRIKAIDFGKINSVSSLDTSFPSLSEYFLPIIKRYEALGYTANFNLLAAPYDFRLSPLQLSDYFSRLQRLIESAMTNSPSDKPVTLVCHSMGCLESLVFLRQQNQNWRAKYIRKLITLSSPWGGAVDALKALIVGETLDIPLLSEETLRPLLRTFPSIEFLLPNKQVFIKPNSTSPVIVETPLKKYRIDEIGLILRDLNLTTPLLWYEQLKDLVQPLSPLTDVVVDCLHGDNLPTPEMLIFKKETDFPNGIYSIINGNGDGTVNYQSLDVCGTWQTMLPTTVKQIVIPNVSHRGILSHKDTLTFISDDVLG